MGLPRGVIVGRPGETALGFQRFGHDVKQAADVADRAMGTFTKRHARCSNGKTDEAPGDRPHGTG
jgi:hypothetical protein